MRRTACSLLLCLAVLSAGAAGDAGDSPGTVEDEFSKESMVQVQFPKGIFPGDQKLRHSEALFGRPSYGSGVSGLLNYTSHSGCSDDPAETLQGQFPAQSIVLMDRHPNQCHFVKRVRAAEAAGARAVLFRNDKHVCGEKGTGCEACTAPTSACPRLPFLADDGTGGDVKIPSMIIEMTAGEKLETALANNKAVSVMLKWNLPVTGDDGKKMAAVDFFYTSDDYTAVEIINNFRLFADKLGGALKFEPHYYIYDGHAHRCDNGACGSQCTNNGRYCEPDPDQTFGDNFEGRDVVAENLRQVCAWKLAKQEKDQTLWWNYVAAFNKDCYNSETQKFTTECANEQLKAVGLSTEQIDTCMGDYGKDTDAQNDRLQQEMELTNDLDIIMLPTIIVNGLILRGHPSEYSMFDAVCAGVGDNKPDVCGCVGGVDKDVLSCVKSGGPPSSGGGGDDGGSFVKPGTFAAVVIVLLLVIALVGVAYYQYMQRRMREQVRNILSEYMPLDDAGEGGAGAEQQARAQI